MDWCRTDEFVWNWQICVELTDLYGSHEYVWNWRISGLKRRGPCVGMTRWREGCVEVMGPFSNRVQHVNLKLLKWNLFELLFCFFGISAFSVPILFWPFYIFIHIIESFNVFFVFIKKFFFRRRNFLIKCLERGKTVGHHLLRNLLVLIRNIVRFRDQTTKILDFFPAVRFLCVMTHNFRDHMEKFNNSFKARF